jgi:hypothetical protein
MKTKEKWEDNAANSYSAKCPTSGRRLLPLRDGASGVPLFLRVLFPLLYGPGSWRYCY